MRMNKSDMKLPSILLVWKPWTVNFSLTLLVLGGWFGGVVVWFIAQTV